MSHNYSTECNDETSVFGHLAVRQTEFEEHPFFEFLAADPSPEWLHDFIPRIGFWAHAFQDVLKLVVQQVSDPTMKSIAVHIRGGDTGHEKWLCADMRKLGIHMPSLPELFGPGYEPARMATYSLMSEVYQIKDDILLIIYLLALESSSYVFFETMTEYLERTSFPIDLKYFGRNHLEAELRHGIVEAEMDIKVEKAIAQASEEVRHAAHALIDRLFAAFNQMFNSFIPEIVRVERTGEFVPILSDDMVSQPGSEDAIEFFSQFHLGAIAVR